MRIALISDQHFDEDSRWEEHLRIMDWIAEDVRTRGVDVIALGGDLFERRPMPIELAAAARWIVKLAETAEVVGVYGNHDVPFSLDVLSRVRGRHPITFYSQPAVHIAGGAAIACMPWPRKAALLATLGRPVAHEVASQAALTALQGILLGLGLELDGAPGERVFLGHCMVRGSRVSSGQPVIAGTDFEIGTEDLGLVRANAYLLGHIHCGNMFDINGAPCFYPGSPRRTAFGEIEDKHYAIVDVQGGRASVELVQTPATRMLLFTACWCEDPDGEGLPFRMSFDGEQTPGAALIAGAECRFRYRVGADRREAARAAANELRQRMLGDGALVVKLEEEVFSTTRARLPALAAAKTLRDKLDILWSVRPDGAAIDEARRARLFGRLNLLEAEQMEGART